jgi:RND family efflux transporter MFP subunit
MWITRERPIEVQVATAVERPSGQAVEVLSASGYVTARRRATISSKITGKVVEVNVEEGMAVREGQILARLDDVNIQAAMRLAEAQVEAARRAVRENEVRLAEARVTLGRRQQLLRDGAVSPAELDQAQAEVDTFDARVAAARQQVQVAEAQVMVHQADLDSTIIRAPFSGVAISKDAQPGEMVSPVSAGGGFTRTGICTIVDMRSLEIEVDVNESSIKHVQARQRVVAILDAYPDWEIPARVITTVPTADRQKATLLVRIAFDRLDPRILPDMGVDVRFFSREEPGAEGPGSGAQPAAGSASQPEVLVPRSALRTESGQPVVFVLNGDTVERRAIRVGTSDGDRVTVVGGLRPGEQVVSPVPESLDDGARVTVR